MTDTETTLRAVTYLGLRPGSEDYGVEIVIATTEFDQANTIRETSTTTWHGVRIREGQKWFEERADLLLAAIGYRRVGEWTDIPSGDPRHGQALGAVIEEITDDE